jgi:hypothetical protein
MTAVTKNTLYSTPAQVIYDLLNDRNNIPDPRRSARTFVYQIDPFSQNIDFSDYPYVWVQDPMLVPIEASANQQSKRLVWTQRITIRTVKDGAGMNRSDQGIKDMRTLNDSIFVLFQGKYARYVLDQANLKLYDFKQVQQPIDVPINNQIIIESVWELSYRVRMDVY